MMLSRGASEDFGGPTERLNNGEPCREHLGGRKGSPWRVRVAHGGSVREHSHHRAPAEDADLLRVGVDHHVWLRHAYHALHRMVLGKATGFDSGSFSAAVSVGVFTTNHAPPEALDELVRVVEPDVWVIFSVREDVYWNEGFEQKQASLEKEGRWRRVTMSEAFQPFPAGNKSHMTRLFVYKTG